MIERRRKSINCRGERERERGGGRLKGGESEKRGEEEKRRERRESELG